MRATCPDHLILLDLIILIMLHHPKIRHLPKLLQASLNKTRIHLNIVLSRVLVTRRRGLDRWIDLLTSRNNILKIAVTTKLLLSELLRNLAMDCLPRICLRRNLFIKPLPSNGNPLVLCYSDF
jgi:hypothetical protein